jgi:glutamine amidotransferase
MANRVVIIDYKLCNLDSIARAVEECGGEATVSDDPAALHRADRIVLPGVGSFAAAIRNLRSTGMDRGLREQLERRRVPFLGICLGMQLLAARSSEGGDNEGLGLLGGDVVRMVPVDAGERVPHIGWNAVQPLSPSPLFEGIAPGTDFYFVHSYHLRGPRAEVLAATPYCGGFASAAARDNVMAVQFHPEKSQRVGFRLLRNFLSL